MITDEQLNIVDRASSLERFSPLRSHRPGRVRVPATDISQGLTRFFHKRMQLSSSLWILADLRCRPIWFRIAPYFNGTRGAFTLQGADFALKDPQALELEPAILPQESGRYFLIGEGEVEVLIRRNRVAGKRADTYLCERM